MAIECAAITVILLVILVMFIRRKNKKWAWAIVPLILVPLTEIGLEVIGKALDFDVSIFACILALLIAAAVACAWAGFISGGFKSRKNSATYTVIANIFNITLAAILIYNVLASTGELSQIITF